jgi:hypothetical protein
MRTSNGKTILLISVFFLQGSIYFSCKKRLDKKISDKELSVITATCSKEVFPISLYYLDGNCSFCLAKAKDFDEKNNNKNHESVIIFMTSNPNMTKMYIEGISLLSCVILDSTNNFAKSFALNTKYEISEKGNILFEIADR